MTESDPVPPQAESPAISGGSVMGLTQRIGAAWAKSPVRAWFTWTRVRNAAVVMLGVFLVTRIVLGLALDYAITRATEGTLGLRCKVGHTALNLTAGQAILGDVALLSSTGTPIATIGRAELDLTWTSLPNLIVERIAIEDVEVFLKRDARGELPALAGLLGGPKKSPAEPSARADQKAQGPIPVVLLKRMRCHHVRVVWEDETVKPPFKGEVLLDMRGDEIATFARPQPPSFSLRLASPGVLDSLRLDLAGRRLEDGASSFDFLIGAEAHPNAIAPYFGPDVQICARTVAVAIEGRANARPTFLNGGAFYTGDLTIERAEITADDDEVDLGRIVAIFSRLASDRVDLSSVSIDHPRFTFGRLADGTLRVLGFGLRGKNKTAAEAAPPPAESGPLPIIKLQELALHDGKVHFRDENPKTPVTIDLEYQARIEDVLVDPESPGRRAKIEASCALPGIIEKASLVGTFVPVGTQRDLALDLTAEGIALAAIAPYLKRAGFEPDLKRGSASASIHAQALTTRDGSLGFSAEVTKARYSDQDEFMSMRALHVEGGLVAKDGTVVIDRIAVDDPSLNVRRHKSGALSVAGIRTARIDPNELPAPAEAVDGPDAAEPAPPAKQGRIRINEVALTGGKIGWRDDALNQPVQLALEGGAFQLTGLALGEPGAAPASLRASAKLRPVAGPTMGDVTLEASLIPDPGAPAISGTMTVRDVSPKPLAAYLKAYSIDPTLERGRLEAGLYLKARFKGAALAESRLVLAPLTLRSGVEELGSIASIELKNTSIDPATHTTNLGDLTITGVRGRAFRDSQGAIRLLGLKLNPRPAGEVAAASDAPVTSAAAAPATQRRGGVLKMGELALKDVSFSWHDETTQPASSIRLMQLDMTLGPRRLDVEPKPGDEPTPLRLFARVDRIATLDVNAGVKFIARAPSVKADVKVTELSLAALASYLGPSGYVPVFDNGAFSARIETQLNLDQGITGAIVELSKVTLTDGGKELFGVDRMRIPFELDPGLRTFNTTEITLSGPRLVAEKTKDGDLLACGLLMKKKAAETAPAPVAPVTPGPAGAKAEKPYVTTIGGVKVEGLALDWRDAEAGDAHLAIKSGSMEVGAIRPGRKTQTPWRIQADLGNLGDLAMSGIAILTTKTTVEGELRITRMNGREISPYLGEGTTLDLDNGTFELKLSYVADPVAAGGQKMAIAVTELTLEEKGVLLVGWDALKADLARSDPVKKVYVIDALELANLRGEVLKLPEGRSRSFGFDKRPVPPPATPRPRKIADAATLADPPPLPSVELRKLLLAASRITIRDRAARNAVEPPPYVIKNVALRNNAPFVLQSDDPTTAILDLALSAESGGTFELASATLRSIPFDAEPQAHIELDVKGLSGDAIMKRSPELVEKYDLSSMKAGVAHVGIDFAIKSHERLDMLGQSPAPLAFELVVDGFEVRSAPGGPVLLGIDDLRMDVSAYDLGTGAMTVRKFEAANPVGVFAKEPLGFRAVDILTKNAPPATATAEPVNAPAVKPVKAPLQRFEKITLTDGEISYIDSTVAPAFDFRMASFEVEILGYSNEWKTSKQKMSFSIRSRGGSYDDMKLKGGLAFFPRIEGDIESLRILGMPLEKLSGYSEQMYKLALRGGRLNIDMRGSFKKGKLKTTCRVTFIQAELEELEGCELPGLKTALGILENSDGEVFLEVPVELELDENLKFVAGSTRLKDLGGLIWSAVSSALGGLAGNALNAITGGKKEVKRTDQASRRRPPVVFGPVEARLPDECKARLDEIAAQLVKEPLSYVSLRGEVGRDDEKRARVLASPAPGDRRDLIARMEAERARLERRRADAISEVRGGLQAGTDDVGTGRSRLVEVTARLQKLDRSLEGLYEQEREGAERAAERRTREIETELCDSRVEAIAAYLIAKGAPVDHVKRRPPKLKPIEEDKGIVAIEAWTASRASIERSATKQETQVKDGSKEPAAK